MARPDEDSSRASGQFDERSFERLFERYYMPVWTFFAHRGFTPDECQDLTQETFLRVFRAIPDFQGQSTFQTWLFRIATNVWKNAIRHRSAARRHAEEISLEELNRAAELAGDLEESGTEGQGLPEARPLPASSPEPLERALSDERARLLREALEKLPSGMRQCMVLRLGSGLKYREISQVLQIPIGTVKSQLNAAIPRLREVLAGHFSDIEVE